MQLSKPLNSTVKLIQKELHSLNPLKLTQRLKSFKTLRTCLFNTCQPQLLSKKTRRGTRKSSLKECSLLVSSTVSRKRPIPWKNSVLTTLNWLKTWLQNQTTTDAQRFKLITVTLMSKPSDHWTQPSSTSTSLVTDSEERSLNSSCQPPNIQMRRLEWHTWDSLHDSILQKNNSSAIKFI